jgi:hypothetical protein
MEQTQPSTTGRKARSIAEFCEAYGFCKAQFYNLKKAGKAPRILNVGARRLITDEAEAEWRAAMTTA